MSNLSIKTDSAAVGEKLITLADWLDWLDTQHNTRHNSQEVQQDLRRWANELGYDPDRLPEGTGDLFGQPNKMQSWLITSGPVDPLNPESGYAIRIQRDGETLLYTAKHPVTGLALDYLGCVELAAMHGPKRHGSRHENIDGKNVQMR